MCQFQYIMNNLQTNAFGGKMRHDCSAVTAIGMGRQWSVICMYLLFSMFLKRFSLNWLSKSQRGHLGGSVCWASSVHFSSGHDVRPVGWNRAPCSTESLLLSFPHSLGPSHTSNKWINLKKKKEAFMLYVNKAWTCRTEWKKASYVCPS